MWNDACRWARQRLPLFVGGELTGNDRRKAERHLIGCADCRGRLASLSGALSALHAAAAEPHRAADSPSLRSALARQIRESRRPSPALWSILEARPFWATAGIAAGVLAAGVAVVSRPLASRPDSRSPRTADAAPRPATPTHPPAAKAMASVRESSPGPARPEGDSLAQNSPPAAPAPTSNPPAPPRVGPRPPAVGIGVPGEPTH